MTTTQQRLGHLARILRLLKPAYWSALDAIKDGPSADAARSRDVLARACDTIDRLASEAVRHFGTDDDSTRVSRPPVRYVVKSHAIAGQPGLALLPAPADPGVERWQRVVPIEKPSEALPPRQPTAAAGATLVRPDTDYEAFLAKQLSPKTRRAYAADMRHFLNVVGLQDPEELLAMGPETLIAYRNSMIEADIAPSTIARRLSTLRSFFSMLVTLGRIEQNPADPKLVRSPRVPREGVTPGIEPHEARKMLKAPDTSKLIGKRDRAILAVGLYLGLRRDEIAGLKLSDVREERGHHVLEVFGKGGKARVLAIPPAAYSAVQDYLTAAGRNGGATDIPLFTSMGHGAGEGQPLSGRDVWNIVRKYADQAGVNREISPHSMRVAAITSALDHGAPIARVQIMAGHADPKTTTRYYRQGEDLDESATYAVRY